MTTADLAGFRDAMVRMRTTLGRDVPFFTPVEGSYAAGTAIDPETDKPFDPTVEATGSGWTQATVRCGVYLEPVSSNMEDDAEETPVGWFEEGAAVLDVAPADYDDNSLGDAEEVELYGERYVITDQDRRGLAGVEHRVLVFVKRK